MLSENVEREARTFRLVRKFLNGILREVTCHGESGKEEEEHGGGTEHDRRSIGLGVLSLRRLGSKVVF